MKFIFEINICTDGDFGFPYIPRGMEYDGYEKYNFDKSYNNEESARRDVLEICGFLKENIHTSRHYVKESFERCVDEFIVELNKFDKDKHGIAMSCMYGNYDGTEFRFYTEDDYIQCGFYASDEEIELFKNNLNGITNEMIKEAVLNLFRNNDNNMEKENDQNE